MGGKDAYVVLHDADLDKTIPMLMSGKFDNSGCVFYFPMAPTHLCECFV
jgi:acyl-CoA reductase-like NAD-dependent aldehyde dehydrogenase